jgi:hypothetical protein
VCCADFFRSVLDDDVARHPAYSSNSFGLTAVNSSIVTRLRSGMP